MLLTSPGCEKVSRRKPLIHCVVSGQPTRASGRWGRPCLASVTSRAGRQQQGLAASCKPLIFSHLTIIRAALKSEQWQMRARGEGPLLGTKDPPKLLAHMCTFLRPVLYDKTWNC